MVITIEQLPIIIEKLLKNKEIFLKHFTNNARFSITMEDHIDYIVENGQEIERKQINIRAFCCIKKKIKGYDVRAVFSYNLDNNKFYSYEENAGEYTINEICDKSENFLYSKGCGEAYDNEGNLYRNTPKTIYERVR